jgi:putative tryptophan/tyrosine transport system substrate-binding protein
VAPLASQTPQPTTVHRIGLLRTGSALSGQSLLASFRQALRDLGYVQGQNLVIESRYAEGRAERLPDLVVELVQLKVDVIVAPSAPAAQGGESNQGLREASWGSPPI